MVRAGTAADVARIAAIQEAASGASHWPPESYLDYDLLVCESEDGVVGYLVTRSTAPDEREILNLAVSPEYRRHGVASRLIGALPPSTLFLEVRESNAAARSLYQKLGFKESGVRKKYYTAPEEDCILMQRI
jgi:ribosomal-protein-alanine N-acetyltransferase